MLEINIPLFFASTAGVESKNIKKNYINQKKKLKKITKRGQDNMLAEIGRE